MRRAKGTVVNSALRHALFHYQRERKPMYHDIPISQPDTAEETNAEQTSLQKLDGVEELARRFYLDYVDLEGFEVNTELVNMFPAAVLFEHGYLPLSRSGKQVTIAVADPLTVEPIDELTAATGFFLRTVVSPAGQITRHLREVLGVGGGTVSDLVAQASGDDSFSDLSDSEADVENDAGASAVIRFVNDLLGDAVQQRASDIHLEPVEDELAVRFRVDGLLQEQTVPPDIHPFRTAIISRLKIMARLNIAEKRLPQDGRIKLTVKAREIDVRVSMIPMIDGEGVVMRLLDKSGAVTDLSGVEFPAAMEHRWKNIISRPHGLILVTGPTGSGKTTTLYGSLSEISSPNTKIITVEDPVEYNLRGINQIQVQEKIGLDFAAGLRSILRHDPDIVLIGEIRDSETANSAIQASMTGHLVLSTLHTNDAPSAMTRLIDLGVEPYLVASTVEAVLAQRLIRRLCVHCKEQYLPDTTATEYGLHSDQPVYRAVGCRDCNGTGYRGRIGVFELMTVDRQVRDLCSRKASADELRAAAVSAGMSPLLESGLDRVRQGHSSLDEVLRVCSSDEESSLQSLQQD